jgi:hypothetical protein
MATDENDKNKLPVTAEVGDEGGSYADATLQTGVFDQPEGDLRVDPKRTAATGGHAQAVASQGEPVDRPDAEVKPPTEPPASD